MDGSIVIQLPSYYKLGNFLQQKSLIPPTSELGSHSVRTIYLTTCKKIEIFATGENYTIKRMVHKNTSTQKNYKQPAIKLDFPYFLFCF